MTENLPDIYIYRVTYEKKGTFDLFTLTVIEKSSQLARQAADKRLIDEFEKDTKNWNFKEIKRL